MSFHLRIVTPERVLSEEHVDSVSLPASNGEITVLTNHVAYIGLLRPGVVKIRRVGTLQEEAFAISGGFARAGERGKLLTILVETAEQGQDLDEEVIAKAKAHAEQVMRQAVRQDDAAFARAAAGLERELARARVVGHARNRHPSSFPIVDKGSIRKDENNS